MSNMGTIRLIVFLIGEQLFLLQVKVEKKRVQYETSQRFDTKFFQLRNLEKFFTKPMRLPNLPKVS
jgi:hypothetical protein